MATTIAIISGSTRYAFLQSSPTQGLGVTLSGPLGSLVIWESGLVEGPDEIAKWASPDAACAAYDDPEVLEQAQRVAVGWLKA